MNYITFKIKLTQNSISVSIINKLKKEEFIELNEGIKEYPIDISFNKNEISICKNQSNILQQLFEQPTQFIKQTIEYQNKRFEVLPETLLTLIIYFFKIKVDEKGIINNFILEQTSGIC